MRSSVRTFRSRCGQALVEYALVIALVGVGLTFALLNLRNSIGNTTNTTSNRIAQVSICSYGSTGAGCTTPTPADPGSGSGNNGGGNGNGNNGNNGNGGGNGNGNNGNGNGNGGGNGSNGNGGGKK